MGRNISHQAGNFAACLYKTKNIVNQEQTILFLFIPKILGQGERRMTDLKAGPGWFIHLGKNHDRFV